MSTFSALRSRIAAIALTLDSSRMAHASVFASGPNCSISPVPFNCRLQGLLHFLYGAAGLLALVLISVVLLAVRFYRRNRTNPKAGE